MNRLHSRLRLLALLALAAVALCTPFLLAAVEGDSTQEEFERGPHRGHLLRDGDFALEVTVFETGVPPEFRLYAYVKDKPIAAKDVQARIEVSRLGGTVDTFAFAPKGDFLQADTSVREPHSFDVKVTAIRAGRTHQWTYASYEGRTTIPAATAAAAGVKTAPAGPATIRERVPVMGSVTVDENRFARVRARFPGPVREVRVGLGDTVTAGQVLALVESNESLRTYAVTAPIRGVITARNTNVGDVAGTAALFEIADLSQVWIDLHAFGSEAVKLKPGQAVSVHSAFSDTTVEATLDRVLPIAAADSQSVVARLRMPNSDGLWRPGLAVSAEVTVAERAVPLAVQTSALQRFRDFTVVFAKVGDTYEVRMLELGARDEASAEVLAGIAPGTTYVTKQSFLIKADIEKSGASHDH